MSVAVPDNACCLTCGYLLRGLPDPMCPECGRSFDPVAPSTFDSNPTGRRRRRWIVRAGVALAIALILFALAPRRLINGTISFTCRRCGEKATVKRWEAVPPGWISFRYPGVHWSSRASSARAAGAQPCEEHRYNVNGRFDLYSGGSCSGWSSPGSGQVAMFNGQPVTLTTAPTVLRSMLAPSNNGITVATGVDPTRGD